MKKVTEKRHPNENLAPFIEPLKSHLFPLLDDGELMRTAGTCTYLYDQITKADSEWKKRALGRRVRLVPGDLGLSCFEQYARVRSRNFCKFMQRHLSSIPSFVFRGIILLKPKIFELNTWHKAWEGSGGA